MAQSISGTNLAANWAASSAKPAVGVICNWNRDASWADAYEDVSAYLLNFTIDLTLYESRTGLPGLGSADAGKATITLDNSDNWFSPDNTSGLVATYADLAADGMYRVPVKIWVGYYEGATAQTICSFTGEIESTNEAEAAGKKTFRLQCADVRLALEQTKVSSTIYSNYLVDDLIEAYAALGGLTDTDLDAAMNRVPTAWLDDGNIWEEIVAVAQSDSGMVYCDELGNLVFRRATAWLERTDSTTAVLTLDRGDISATDTGRDWRDCYTKAIVEYAPRYEGAVTSVYENQGWILVPPGETVTDTYQLDSPCSAVISPVAGTDYQVISSAGVDLSSDLTVTVTADAQRADVEFVNGNSYHAIYVYQFTLRGRPVLAMSAQEVAAESALSLIPDAKDYSVRDNVYFQAKAQAEMRAGMLRDWLQRPRRILNYTGPCAPWLQLGDRVTAQDSDAGIDEDCYVIGKNISYSGGSLLNMRLALLPVTNLFAHADYFTLGTSDWDTTTDPLFY